MAKKRYFFNPCYEYINHTPIVKTLDIRKRYRVYLAEMESYKFFPLDFRTWYGWEKHHGRP